MGTGFIAAGMVACDEVLNLENLSEVLLGYFAVLAAVYGSRANKTDSGAVGQD